MQISIGSDARIVSDFLRDFGPRAQQLARYAVVSATRKTYAEARRYIVATTGVQAKRLKKRVFFSTKGREGIVWVGTKPFPAAWFTPIDPRRLDPRRQRTMAGTTISGGRITMRHAFTLDGKSGPVVVRRTGKGRTPLTIETYPLPPGWYEALESHVVQVAAETLDRELATRISRLVHP